MLVDLVHTKTSDGVRLHGALEPQSASTPAKATERGVDAMILVHGVGSNFYSSVVMQSISEGLHEEGITTLRVNTRGHDALNTVSTERGGWLQGAAMEIVDHCRLDLAAWTDFLVRRGFSRIGWLGHSLGAIKILYAQAHQPHTAVSQLVAISPPRLAHSRLATGHNSDAFRSSWLEAQHWLDQQQPQMLFRATFPFPLILSAATFCDKYGPEERYNILRFTSRISVPVTFIFGRLELHANNDAFDQLDQELAQAEWARQPAIHIIEGANHFYSGCLPELLRVMRSCV